MLLSTIIVLHTISGGHGQCNSRELEVKKMDERFGKVDRRFEELERQIDERFKEVVEC